MRIVSNHFALLFVLLSSFIFVFQISGCATDSYAAKGAGQGATTGAVSGAVGGFVSALVFGGDPGEAMARGAVYGGAVGATAGAMAGAQADSKIAEKQEKMLKELRAQIGDESYNGLAALTDCNHSVALSHASRAKKDSNPNHALPGYWLEVMSYSDQGNKTKVNSLLPALVEKDWHIKTMTQAEEKMHRAMNGLMDIREQYKLPRTCGG